MLGPGPLFRRIVGKTQLDPNPVLGGTAEQRLGQKTFGEPLLPRLTPASCAICWAKPAVRGDIVRGPASDLYFNMRAQRFPDSEDKVRNDLQKELLLREVARLNRKRRRAARFASATRVAGYLFGRVRWRLGK